MNEGLIILQTCLLAVNCFFYFKVFLEYSKDRMWFFSILFAMVQEGISFIINTGNLLLVANIGCFVLFACLFCQGTWRGKIFFSVLFVVIHIILETIIVCMISLSYGEDVLEKMEGLGFTYIDTTVEFVLFLIIMLLQQYRIKKKSENTVYWKDWVVISGVLILSIAIVVVIGNNVLKKTRLQGFYMIVLTFVFFVDIALFYVFYMISKERSMEQERLIYEKQQMYYQSYYDTTKRIQEEIREFRHEIKNYKMLLKKYTEQNMTDEAQHCISQVENDMEKVEVDTGNFAIDSILNEKFQLCKEKSILLKKEVWIPENFRINEVDILIVLGNLLDNAIEATEKTDKSKPIEAYIKYDAPNLLLHIMNPYSGTLPESSIEHNHIKWKTSKENKQEHGIGLTNVQKVLDKYNGYMNITTDANLFDVKAVMYQIENGF
jgi:sensor histidine kinase YesM